MTLTAHLVPPVTGRRAPRRSPLVAVVLLLAVAASAACAVAVARHVRDADLHRHYLGPDGWPTQGQAAYGLDGVTHIGPRQHPAPIASVAKVMTAYVVLHARPLTAAASGPSLTVRAADVADYERRKAAGQSVVVVKAGERLTERQALQALLLPSANNVAVLLARFAAGTVEAFVDRMNDAARRLGMTDTRYTDPSGFDSATVSTARDQLRLASALSDGGPASQTFAVLVAARSATLPVAGRITTTNALLGEDAFTGTKTGSDDAAGGCFMFRTWRLVRGHVVDMVGVVMGQRGRHDITAGIYTAKQLADHVGRAATGI